MTRGNPIRFESGFSVRPFQIPDIEAVSEIHLNVLPGFLAQLGPSVIRYFYRSALERPGSFGWVARREETVAGFVFFSMEGSEIFSGALHSRLLKGAVLLAQSCFRKPARLITLFQWLLRKDPAPGRSPVPELIYLAVHKGFQGRGVGSILMRQLSDFLREKGQRYFELSVGADDRRAQIFYERTGGRYLYDLVEVRLKRKRYGFQL